MKEVLKFFEVQNLPSLERDPEIFASPTDLIRKTL
jgi:hypothetical protein